MWEAFVGLNINILMFIYQLVGNFGVAIILFTILIRLVTHPLTVSQLKSSSAMQALQTDKRWIDAQNKYKNDKDKLSQEQMKLYKELGINPFSSCLPMIIQLPIIFALYQAIIRAMASTPMELLSLTRAVYPSLIKVASIIPLDNRFLWMDLGQPERLNLSFLPFGIPVMAILVMASTYLQSKLMAPPTDPTTKDQTQMMTGMMNIYMPLLMGYLGLTLASGLSLYFVISNVIGILQYALLGKLNWSNVFPSKKDSAKKEPGKKETAKKK